MYLLSQMAVYLFLAFLLGIAIGYALWRTWGEREFVAKFNAAEMRLAAHVARMEKANTQPDAAAQARASAMRAEEAARHELRELEIKHATLLKEAEVAAIRKAEAAAEKKLNDLASKLGYDVAGLAARPGAQPFEPIRRSAEISPLFDPPREVRKGD